MVPLTVIVTGCVATVPSRQRREAAGTVHVPADVVALTPVIEVGRVSLTSTPTAVDGPPLVTVIVHVTGPPATVPPDVAALAMRTWALRVTSVTVGGGGSGGVWSGEVT